MIAGEEMVSIRIVSMLPSVTSAISDKGNRTATELHHQSCGTIQDIISLQQGEIEELHWHLSDDSLGEQNTHRLHTP